MTLPPAEFVAALGSALADMEPIPGGTFQMGSDHHYPEERPAHPVTVDAFWIDRAPVTNADFRRFVEATGHVTLAERAPNPEDYPGRQPDLLVPASAVFLKGRGWRLVPGANWRHPLGPNSTIEGRDGHPVVQVAYEDAAAYARWAGKQLPTEAELELAARGGLQGAEFAWGHELAPEGQMMANIGVAGYAGTSPVGAFPPNGYGLYDTIGNVWAWTADWYAPHGGAASGDLGVPGVQAPAPAVNPREASFDPHEPVRVPRKVLKGGSYLCAPTACRRYRPAARIPQPIDTAACHLGFRCVLRAG